MRTTQDMLAKSFHPAQKSTATGNAMQESNSSLHILLLGLLPIGDTVTVGFGGVIWDKISVFLSLFTDLALLN